MTTYLRIQPGITSQQPSWRTHSCVPCRDSSRHVFASRTPGVGMSADVARKSACATVATKCQVILRALRRALCLTGVSFALAAICLAQQGAGVSHAIVYKE